MSRNKIEKVDQNMEFEESKSENESCTSIEWKDSSMEGKYLKSNSQEIKLELKKIGTKLTSLSGKSENLLIKQNFARGDKRKINCRSLLSISDREKCQKTSSCTSHLNNPVNSFETPSVIKKTSELHQQIISNSLHNIDPLNALKNPTVTKKSSKSIEDLFKNTKESEKVFHCTLPGCNRKFRRQNAYDIHIKHFHGIFNLKKYEPIITASSYDSKKIVDNKADCKPSHGFKGLKTVSDNIKLLIYNKSRSSTSLYQMVKLTSKFSYLEVLLPSSLTKKMEAISTGKTVAEVINKDFNQKIGMHGKLHMGLNVAAMVCNDKNILDFESGYKNSSESCWKNNLLTKSYSKNIFSVKKSSIQLLTENGSQSNSNDKNVLSDDTQYVRPHIRSSSGDNIDTKVVQLNTNLEESEKSISDLKTTIQEEHLYASNNFNGNCNDLINLKKKDYCNLSSRINENKDKIKELSQNCEKLGTGHSSILLDHQIDNSKDVCSYEEFVKKKEMEYLDVGSLKSKFSILNKINHKKNAKTHIEISNISTAVSLALNSSFASISNLESNISQNTEKRSGKNIHFIRRAFEICNCAKNLREILFKCKEILDNIGSYVIPKGENIDKNLPGLADFENKGQTNKLLHYVFFLDVLRDPAFFFTYTPHILTKTEFEVLHKLTNPVSLYLKNTKMELPNAKLRRDREFLQRNSDFFSVLLKIQKSCYILPYNRSIISIEELYRPPTKLRLEKSDFFTQVFSDIVTKKGHILMQSYGCEKDLSVSPFVECVCDDYNVHKLSGFVLLPKPDNRVAKDMCVGLCFESIPLSLGDCISELFSIVEEIKKNIAEVSNELHKENAEYSLTEMKNNLLNIFDMIGTELKSVFSSLNVIRNFVNKQSENKDTYLVDLEKELIKDSLTEIGRIVGDLEDLKECHATV